MSTEFREAVQHSNVYSMTGSGHCFVAGRLSFALGLHGICEAIDTACSASLVACHHAHRAVSWGDSERTMFAGVNMMFLPSTTAAFVAAGLASASGKSFVFDARADGLVAVIVVLDSRGFCELGEVLHDQRRVFPQDHPRRVRDAALDVPLPKQNVPV